MGRDTIAHAAPWIGQPAGGGRKQGRKTRARAGHLAPSTSVQGHLHSGALAILKQTRHAPATKSQTFDTEARLPALIHVTSQVQCVWRIRGIVRSNRN